MKTGRYRIKYFLGIMMVTVIFSNRMIYAADTENLQEETERVEESVTDSQENLRYVAMGDSIPNGYVAADETEITGYPWLIAEDMMSMSGRETELMCYTRNGLTTKGLYERYLSDPEVMEQVKDADLITVTIGANDLLNEFKRVSQEILNIDTKFRDANSALDGLKEGIEANPLLLVKVAAAIGGWDYDAFEQDWIRLMENISGNCNEHAQVVVTMIYNPVSQMELPGTLNLVVDMVIKGMNDIIFANSEIYGYCVADLFESEIGDHTQSDGLHPNQEGQELIRELVEAQVNMEEWTVPEGEDDEIPKGKGDRESEGDWERGEGRSALQEDGLREGQLGGDDLSEDELRKKSEWADGMLLLLAVLAVGAGILRKRKC